MLMLLAFGSNSVLYTAEMLFFQQNWNKMMSLAVFTRVKSVPTSAQKTALAQTHYYIINFF
jgi:hypothetical protein